MKFMTFLTFITLSLSAQSFADTNEVDEKFYKDLLEKHKLNGHLNESETKKQQFQISNQKSWQKDFKKQVRGVASSIKVSREKIKLNNPAIEISVK